VEIARSDEKKLEFLRRFRRFADGTPSHNQLGDIFAVLDAEQFSTASSPGVAAHIIAIDSKRR
jgi:hypothetical protein